MESGRKNIYGDVHYSTKLKFWNQQWWLMSAQSNSVGEKMDVCEKETSKLLTSYIFNITYNQKQSSMLCKSDYCIHPET